MVWLPGSAPTGDYWSQIAARPRTTLTISHEAGPSGLWVALKVPAIKLSKYPFRCRDHKCSGPRTPRPVFIHLHGTSAIRPEIQQALSVLLQEPFLPASEGSYVSTFSHEAVDLDEAMQAYGQKMGYCGHCGRHLTNDESRKRGLGSVCATK